MTTLTSKDLGTSNSPSIRLFAPPGGHSNIIFGDEGDDKQQMNQNESDTVGNTINQNYQPSQQLSPFTNQQPLPDYYDSLTNVQQQQPQSRMSPIDQNLNDSLPVSPSPVRNQFDSNNRPNSSINNNDQGLTMEQKILGTTSSNLNSYTLPPYNHSSSNTTTSNNNNNNINHNNANGISETVYLEILAESMFQNGQTTVNQLDELSHEIMSLSKQCFIVASVCKQNDDTLNKTNNKMNTTTNNSKFATSGTSSSSNSSNINSTVAKGYEDDVNDLIPSVTSSIIDHASKLLEANLFVALKESSDASIALNSDNNGNNYNSSSSSENQSNNDSASILINQLASIIAQLKRLQTYHYQQVNYENEVITIRRYEVYQLVGECLQTICSHAQTLKSNIMTLQLQADQFSLNLEANSNKNDNNTNNRLTPSTTHNDTNYNNNNTPLRNNSNIISNNSNNKSLNNSSSSSAIRLSMSQELNEIRRIKLQQELEEERRKQEINALAPLATTATNKVLKLVDTATSRRVKEAFDYLKQYNEEYKSRKNQISSFVNILTPLLSKYWFKQVSRRFHQWNRITLQLATGDKHMKEVKNVQPLLQVPLTPSAKSASSPIVPSLSTIQPAHSSNNTSRQNPGTDNNKIPLAVSNGGSSDADHNKKIEELEKQIATLQTLYSASINPQKQQLKTCSDTDEQEDNDGLLSRRNDKSSGRSSNGKNSINKGSGRLSSRSDKKEETNTNRFSSLLSSSPPLPPSSSSLLSTARQSLSEAIMPPPSPPSSSSSSSSTSFPSSSSSQVLAGKNIIIKSKQEALMMLSFEVERLGMKVTQLEKENIKLKQQLLKKR